MPPRCAHTSRSGTGANTGFRSWSLSVSRGAEQNYWHFHDDVLSRLLVLDESDIPSNAPLLVGRALWDTKFFQSVIRRDPLRDREWMVHDSLVRADRLFLPIRGSLRSDTPRGLQRLLASGPGTGSRRLFLFRGRSRSRALRNSDELAAALTHGFGFEAVDTDELTFDEQANLFADARFIVATHGAGLTNLIHRLGAPTTLVELFPSDYVHPHFAWLAQPPASSTQDSSGA